MIESSQQIDPEMLKGRNRRLWHEWHLLEEGLSNRRNITFKVTRRNAEGLPTGYLVYYDLRSICGVTHEEELNEPGVENHPIFARGFQMTIDLPNGYPCVFIFRPRTLKVRPSLIHGIRISDISEISPVGYASIWQIHIPTCCGEWIVWHPIFGMIHTMP